MTTDPTPTMVNALRLLDQMIAALSQSHHTIAVLVGENAKLRRQVADRDGSITDLQARIAAAGGVR